MDKTAAVTRSLRAAWLAQAQANPLITLGLLGAVVVVLVLLVGSGINAFQGQDPLHVRYAMLGGLAGFATTALGALSAVLLRSVSIRTQDCMLGFAAGMMLAAACFSLILPGLAAAREILSSGPGAALTVVLGLGLGVLLMLGLDYFTPHEHESTGPCGPEAQRINRVWLFVLAIALHNIPEGMAIGVSFADGDLAGIIPIEVSLLGPPGAFDDPEAAPPVAQLQVQPLVLQAGQWVSLSVV